jgi:hypothetical protein
MNNSPIKSIIVLLCAIASAFLLPLNGMAKTDTKLQHHSLSVTKVTAATKHKILNEKIPTVAEEATDIDLETQKAIVALGHKDTKGAAALLQGVSNKLDVMLKMHPDMTFITVNVDTELDDFSGSSKDISHAVDEAKDLLKQGKIQAARQLLSGLASEIRVTTTSIPLGTYPAAIKKIIPLITEGKIDQAVIELNDVFDTLEVQTEIRPLPVFRAEELLTVAAELEHKDDLSKEKNRAEIKAFTDAAQDQLKLAELLGYGGKEDYKTLYKEIDAIDGVLFSDKSDSIWKQIKDSLSGLKTAVNRIGHPAH